MAYSNSGIKRKINELSEWLCVVVDRMPKGSYMQTLATVIVNNEIEASTAYYVAFHANSVGDCLNALAVLNIHLIQIRTAIEKVYLFSRRKDAAHVITETQYATFSRIMKLLEHQINNFTSKKAEENAAAK